MAPDWKTVSHLLCDDPPSARLLYGQDVRKSLQGMPEGSVHCVVTSPPYWGLRSYLDATDANKSQEIGAEATLDAYVENLVGLFRDLRRVLRKDGTAWLNLGDSYLGGGRAGKNPEYWQKHTSFGKADPVVRAGGFGLPSEIPEGMKPKDMAGVPWRVAFALQADGWYLRSAAPWVRRNVMPESCTDRPSASVEYLFLLAHPDSGGRYYYDLHGQRPATSSLTRIDQRHGKSLGIGEAEAASRYGVGGSGRHRTKTTAGQPVGDKTTRQRRATDWFFESVQDIAAGGQTLLSNDEGDPLAFVVNPKPYAGAHFAVFPEGLVEPCVLLSTSAHGACSKCGAQYQRVVEREGSVSKASQKSQAKKDQGLATAFNGYEDGSPVAFYTTTGWEPTCACGAPDGVEPGDLNIIRTPTSSGTERYDSKVMGRPRPARASGGGGWNRPRAPNEGTRPITEYERKQYAAQIRDTSKEIQDAMQEEVGEEAFAHYRKPGSASGRPPPPDVLDRWIACGWLKQVEVPVWDPPTVMRPVVLDPFSGSGTTGAVSLRLGRDYVGTDINASYLPLAEARLRGERPPEDEPEVDSEGSVFDLFGEED